VGSYSYDQQLSGEHTYRVETSGLKAGTYFVRVSGNGFEKTSKILVINP
jgi:hypothetical protein